MLSHASFVLEADRDRTVLQVDGGCAVPNWSFRKFVAEMDMSARGPFDAVLGGAEPFGETEFQAKTGTGARRWLLGRIRSMPDGTFRGLFVTIDGIKEREDRDRVIRHEMAHRFKNHISVVQSLARLSLRHPGMPSDAIDVFEARLMNLARSHDLLDRQEMSGASLRDVVDEAIAPFEPRPGRFLITETPIVVTPRIAKALALALHELCTNSIKYGALSSPAGTIELSWRIDLAKDRADLYLSWVERGGPPIRQLPTRTGFGTRIIRDWLAAETGGAVTIDYTPLGLTLSLRAPLPRVASQNQ
ncbi:sensor histidine kinase [Bosea sp. (in: a-proteobacteria)]|uniref:sensor histidine kinase n=1 Tax=Bosea sp. (in: a-proteobacteria) TaxID=1871050 RepID=UPI003B3A7219